MNNKPLLIGIILTGLLLFIAFFGSYLPFIDTKLEAQRLYFPEPGAVRKAPFPPSERHLLGSDRDGRDILSILVLGASETLGFILGVVLVRYILAVPLGLLSYKKKGPISFLVQGWDKVFSSLPSNLLIIILLNIPFLLFHDQRIVWAFFIIALFDLGRVAHIVQQQAFYLSKEPYIDTARTIGVKPFGIVKNHLLPGLTPEIITNFCLDIGRVTLLIGQLAVLKIFLSQAGISSEMGYIVENTSLDWSSLMKDSKRDIVKAFWIPFFAAAALTYTIVSFNMLGEGLRRYFNRHLT